MSTTRQVVRATRIAAIAVGLVAGLFSTGAAAWGPQGHAIVANIAEAHLNKTARGNVEKLLKRDGVAHLDEIASWADAIRDDHPNTAPWHYVDIPLSADGLDTNRDCAEHKCLVVQLVRHLRVLDDDDATSTAQTTALKFVVHLMGDLHQPLHTADNDDRGGNDTELTYFGQPSNLHRVWDSAIIERALDLHTGPDFAIDRDATRAAAKRLDQAIRPAAAKQWTRGTLPLQRRDAVVAWTNESHRLARAVAYSLLPEPPRPDGWSARYQQQTWPYAKVQLQRGGRRLAAMLNAVLGPE